MVSMHENFDQPVQPPIDQQQGDQVGAQHEEDSPTPVPVSALLRDLADGKIHYASFNGAMPGDRAELAGRYAAGLEGAPLLVTEVLGAGTDNIALRLAGEIAGQKDPVLKIGQGEGPRGYQGSRPYDTPLLARGSFVMPGNPEFGDTEGYWYVQPYRDINVTQEDFEQFRDRLDAMGVTTQGDLGYAEVGQVGYDENGRVDLVDYNAVGKAWGEDYGETRPAPVRPKATISREESEAAGETW